ncbi:MAG: YrbL family protein [Methylophagaceae bacterium]
MITLSPETMIGKGLHRECFAHPDDENKCIKVVVNGNQQETEREQSYYKLLEKRNISWEMLPRFHGNIETNMGTGAVFDLIRDHNDNVSNSLEHYLADEDYVAQNKQHLLLALAHLKLYLLENNIISMPIKSKNILYQIKNDGTGTLHIVDNIGNADFIPIASYLYYFGNKKIMRRWNRFFNALAL